MRCIPLYRWGFEMGTVGGIGSEIPWRLLETESLEVGGQAVDEPALVSVQDV